MQHGVGHEGILIAMDKEHRFGTFANLLYLLSLGKRPAIVDGRSLEFLTGNLYGRQGQLEVSEVDATNQPSDRRHDDIIHNNNGCFDFVRQLLRTRSSKKMLWTLAIVTFLISINLDNLTTTVMMLTMMHGIIPSRRQRMVSAFPILPIHIH